jgi:type IV pilus assembly protein PilV
VREYSAGSGRDHPRYLLLTPMPMKTQTLRKVVGQSRLERGFSLIEILVSLLLITIALTGVAALLATTHKNSASSYLRTQASLLGNDIAEKIRANRATMLANPTAYTTLPSGCTALSGTATIFEQDLHQFICLVKSTLPGSDAAISFDSATNILTIGVSWDDSRGTSGATRQTFQFETQL